MVVQTTPDDNDPRLAQRRRREKYGQVYLAEAMGLRRVKIGFSIHAIRRLSNLAVMCPVPLQLLVLLDGPPELERELHHKFRANWCHGEWFDLEPRMERFIDQHALPEPILIMGARSPQPLPDSVPQRMSYVPDRPRRRAAA